MGAPFFRFKQFTVWHDQCAMKVGTDGVLLGAWCPLPFRASERVRVLDVGVGSGLIALMIAQRLHLRGDVFSVCGLDIDHAAVEQSHINFQQSPWAECLTSQLCRLQDFSGEQLFELIVSNPPYFQNSLKNPNQARATARHTATLSYRELIAHTKRLLADNGVLALVLPSDAEQEIMALAHEYQLTPTHITYVHSKPGKVAKRILIAFTHQESKPHARGSHQQDQHKDITPMATHFYIESDTAPRSEEYQTLTQDFYL